MRALTLRIIQLEWRVRIGYSLQLRAAKD